MDSVFLARQVVFNKKSQVWGYELLFRSTATGVGDSVDGCVATRSVIADGLSLAMPLLQNNQRMLVNVPEELLLNGVVQLLPASCSVVEILETTQASKKLLDCLRGLKILGFKLALDDYVGQPHLESFLPVVDIVKIDVLYLDKDTISLLVNKLRRDYPQLQLLAEKVEDAQTYYHCRDLGCDFYQGYFFQRPELLRGRKINTSTIIRLRLIALLSVDDFEMSKVGALIRSDAPLSYKLFRYINCVANGLASRVNSVEHGITILGRRKLLYWLTATLTSVFGSNGFAWHLTHLSAINAFFLSSLCPEQTENKQLNEGNLYLLGLFMHLERLVDDSFTQLLREISISTEVSQALIKRSGLLAPWLTLLEAYENGNWLALREQAQLLGLDEKLLRSLSWLHAEACRRVNQILIQGREDAASS